MAYLDYEFTQDDTFFSIADYYGITVSELFRINNIREPVYFPKISTYVEKMHVNLTSIKVPELRNGRETLENRDISIEPIIDNRSNISSFQTDHISGVIGHASQYKCWLDVGGVRAVFPCYPESYSDSHVANFSPQSILGRSEPFQIYQNSGPRTVNVSFRMHREMTQTTPIGDIVGIVQSACYPIGSEATIVPRVTLVIGANCSITGIIPSVSTNWSDTIIENLYQVVTLDFSVIECTGNPKTAGIVIGLGGR